MAPNVSHLQMTESTELTELFNAAEMFLYLDPILSWRSIHNSLQFLGLMAWFVVWHALATIILIMGYCAQNVEKLI